MDGKGGPTISCSAAKADDRLIGGDGNDRLTGGKGSDAFVFWARGPATTWSPISVPPATARSTASGLFGFSGARAIRTTTTILPKAIRSSSTGGVFQNFWQVLAASHQVGHDTVITIDANDSITLQGVFIAQPARK